MGYPMLLLRHSCRGSASAPPAIALAAALRQSREVALVHRDGGGSTAAATATAGGATAAAAAGAAGAAAGAGGAVAVAAAAPAAAPATAAAVAAVTAAGLSRLDAEAGLDHHLMRCGECKECRGVNVARS